MYRRRRAARQLAEISQAQRARLLLSAMTPSEAAALLRDAIGSDADLGLDPEVMAMIADRAADGAGEVGRTVLGKIAASYRGGGRVKFQSAPVTLLREGESAELVFDVESAFARRGDNE
jgi:sirohydrochlorin ferrochelatase